MIKYVDDRLREWGIWSNKAIDGWFPCCQYDYDEHVPGGMIDPSMIGPVIDEQAMEMEMCVAQLNREMQSIIIAQYRDHLDETAEQKASRFGISKRTYFNRIDAAHVLLLGIMNDREAEGRKWVKQILRVA